MDNKDAVSEVIGMIFVMFIVISSIGMTAWFLPMLEDKKASICADSMYNQLDNIDAILHNMISQGEHCSRNFNIGFPQGDMMFGKEGNRFIIFYSLIDEFDFNLSDFDDNSFNFSVHKPKHAHPVWLNATSLIDGSKESIHIVVNKPHPVTEVIFDDLNLNGAIEIDIIQPSLNSSIGRIWIFDMGYIKYTTSSSRNTYEVIAENGGIHKGRNSLLLNCPKIWIGDDYFIMRIIKLNPEKRFTIGGGDVEFSLLIKINQSQVLEIDTYIPCLKIQILGDYADHWTRYFKKYFNQWDSGILYLEEKNFSLTYSHCDIFLR